MNEQILWKEWIYLRWGKPSKKRKKEILIISDNSALGFEIKKNISLFHCWYCSLSIVSRTETIMHLDLINDSWFFNITNDPIVKKISHNFQPWDDKGKKILHQFINYKRRALDFYFFLIYRQFANFFGDWFLHFVSVCCCS